MGAPAWLTGSFAALMLTVATYCVGRLAVTRRWQRPTELDTDAGHVLMGLAMAPSHHRPPPHQPTTSPPPAPSWPPAAPPCARSPWASLWPTCSS